MLASSTTSPQTTTNYSCSPAAPPRCVSPPVTFGSRCLVSLSQYPPLPSWHLRVQVSGIARPEPPHLSPSLWCGLPLVYSLFVVICGWASLSYSVVRCSWMILPEHSYYLQGPVYEEKVARTGRAKVGVFFLVIS